MPLGSHKLVDAGTPQKTKATSNTFSLLPLCTPLVALSSFCYRIVICVLDLEFFSRELKNICRHKYSSGWNIYWVMEIVLH